MSDYNIKSQVFVGHFLIILIYGNMSNFNKYLLIINKNILIIGKSDLHLQRENTIQTLTHFCYENESK